MKPLTVTAREASALRFLVVGEMIRAGARYNTELSIPHLKRLWKKLFYAQHPDLKKSVKRRKAAK